MVVNPREMEVIKVSGKWTNKSRKTGRTME